MTNLVLGGGGGEAAAYTVDQSLRFNLGDSAYLSRTPSEDGNRKTWTFSFWYKCVDPSFPGDRDILSDSQAGAPTDEHWFRFGIRGTNNQLLLFPGYNYNIYGTSAFFRDVGAWYHIVLRVDTTQASWDDRVRVYVNGESKTIINVWTLEGEPPQDWVTGINSTDKQELMVYSYGTDVFVDGYLAEVYMIDGQSLAPSSFGETDEDTNQWKPIDASGLTFGTNGFYLKFQDSADFGDDSSGNGNDYTATNLVATDQMKDSPTNNFATFNPLIGYAASGARMSYTDLSEGNLKAVGNYGSETGIAPGTFSFGTGKWYVEFVATSLSGAYPHLGIIETTSCTSQGGYAANSVMYKADGGKVEDSTNTGGVGDSWVAGDVIGMAIDCTNGAVYFAKNNVWQNSGVPTSGATKTGAFMTWTGETIDFVTTTSPYTTSAGVVMNCGSDSSFAGNETAQGNTDGNGVGDFYYEPPTDFLALASNNLPVPSIKKSGSAFNTVLYTGDGATTLAVTGVGFAPSFTWIKNRVATDKHVLVDAVRGANNYLSSNSTAVEVDASTFVASLDSDGFTVGNDAVVNTNTENYVSWNWLAGGAPTADNDNTSGAMDANSVSLNGSLQAAYTPSGSPTIYPTRMSIDTNSGTSIITYNGNSTAGATIPHGLSQAPEMVIFKRRTFVGNWIIGSDELTSWDYYVDFHSLNEVDFDFFNDTGPTASVISLSDAGAINYDNTISGNGTYVAYCFHSSDVIKVGGYTGNGNDDGTFVFTGMRPSFLLLKSLDGSSHWEMQDDKRDPYNVNYHSLQPNLANAADTGTTRNLDFLSNGFKLRSSYYAAVNGSGNKYLYLACAAYPFKYAPAR